MATSDTTGINLSAPMVVPYGRAPGGGPAGYVPKQELIVSMPYDVVASELRNAVRWVELPTNFGPVLINRDHIVSITRKGVA